MTSWNRGRENEEEGESRVNSQNLGDKVAGAGKTVAGKVEQGVDNLGDTLSGKQGKLEGDTAGNAPERAGEWAHNRAQDVDEKID